MASPAVTAAAAPAAAADSSLADASGKARPLAVSSRSSRVLAAIGAVASLYGGWRLFDGAVGSERVFWAAYLTAAASAFGALPFYLKRSADALRQSEWLGVAGSIAGGMMLAASFILAVEGADEGHAAPRVSVPPPVAPGKHGGTLATALNAVDDPLGAGALEDSAPLMAALAGALSASRAWQRMVLGAALGGLCVLASKRLLERYEDLRLGGFAGADARRAALVLLVMASHSATEGIAVGAAFADTHAHETAPLHALPEAAAAAAAAGEGDASGGLGRYIALSLAAHNVPEALACCLVLIPKGTPILEAAVWAVATALPQPLFAPLAYAAVNSFSPLLPAGLGFAAGAMAWVALAELLPEAAEEVGKARAVRVAVLSAVAMLLFQFLLH